MKRDYREARLNRKTRAILDYAVKLTKTPGAMAKADVDGLREAGWDDQAIHDAAQVTAAFNYYNRLADGLGIDLEPEMPKRRGGGRPAGPAAEPKPSRASRDSGEGRPRPRSRRTQ